MGTQQVWLMNENMRTHANIVRVNDERTLTHVWSIPEYFCPEFKQKHQDNFVPLWVGQLNHSTPRLNSKNTVHNDAIFPMPIRINIKPRKSNSLTVITDELSTNKVVLDMIRKKN